MSPCSICPSGPSLYLSGRSSSNAPLSGASYRRYYADVVRQHEAMVGAIEAGDAERADALAREHARLFRRRVTRSLQAGLAGDMKLEG